MTNDGCPVAHPKLQSLPSAITSIPLPVSGNTHLSNYYFILVFLIPGQFSRPAISISLSK